MCKRICLVLLAIIVLSGCVTVAENKGTEPLHHNKDGFTNPYLEKRIRKRNVSKWLILIGTIKSRQKDIITPLIDEGTDLDRIYHPDPNKIQVTWIGHASFLVQVNGLNILTDPMFSDYASPLQFMGPKRLIEPGIKISQLPHIDAVVISHNHYDHLDVNTVRALDKDTLFLVPLGLKRWFADNGRNNVAEYDWWQGASLGSVDFTLVPSQHFSSRIMFDFNDSLWGGWLIKSNTKKILFVGDSGYFPGFKEIYNKYGAVDLALIPIGAYEPRKLLKPFHINPEEAVLIHQDVHAKNSIAMHFGTFPLSEELPSSPITDLNEALKKYEIPKERFITMKIGETRGY